MEGKRDYYELLGVDRNAGGDEIKKAYRKQALKYHPDRNPGDKQAEEKFKAVSEAYQVISDPEKKAQYDRFGHAAFDGRSPLGPGFDFTSGFEDVFGDIFGDFFGTGTGRRRSQAQRGDDLRYNLDISFEEAAFGVEKKIKIPRHSSCDSCKGSGAKPGSSPRTCSTCRGRGQVNFQQGFFSVSRTCGQCRGRGSMISDPCPTCSGSTRIRKLHTLGVKIPAGVDTGSLLKLRGEGEGGSLGGPSGDLYVALQVKEHPIFARDGSEVICELPISFLQAALGAEIEVPTLGGKVKLKIPAGVQSGRIFRLKGKGIKDVHSYHQGDQHVRVLVETPTHLTVKQKELLKDFAAHGGEEVNPLSKGFFDKVRQIFG